MGKGMNNFDCKLSMDERFIHLPGVDLGMPQESGKGYPVHSVLHRDPTVVVIRVPGHMTWAGTGRPRRWEPAYFVLYELIEVTNTKTKARWKGQFPASPATVKKERE